MPDDDLIQLSLYTLTEYNRPPLDRNGIAKVSVRTTGCGGHLLEY